MIGLRGGPARRPRDPLARRLSPVRRGPPRLGSGPSRPPPAGLPSLALAGAALHGVGIPACIGSGRRAARAVVGAALGAAAGVAP